MSFVVARFYIHFARSYVRKERPRSAITLILLIEETRRRDAFGVEDAWLANKVIHTVGAPGRAISSALPPECRLIRHEPRFQVPSPPSLCYSRRWLLVFAQPSAWLSTRTAPPRRWEIPDLLSFDFSLFSLRRWVSFELCCRVQQAEFRVERKRSRMLSALVVKLGASLPFFFFFSFLSEVQEKF